MRCRAKIDMVVFDYDTLTDEQQTFPDYTIIGEIEMKP